MTIDVNVHHYFHFPGGNEILAKLDKVADSINSLKDYTMSSQAEAAATLAAVLEQQKKTAAEIASVQASVDTLNATIATLTDELANATTVSPELQAAVDAVKAQAQIVDDLIPDLPVPPAP
jgi:cell division protein FtsB